MQLTEKFEDCYAVLTERNFTIGNKCIERVWNLNECIPTVQSLRNKKTGKEWMIRKECKGWPYINKPAAFAKGNIIDGDYITLTATTSVEDDLGIAVRHMKVEICFDYPVSKIRWTHIIYPELAIIRAYITCEFKNPIHAEDLKLEKELPFENLEISRSGADYRHDDFIDFIPVETTHCRWKSVLMSDVTDHHNNLVKTEEGLFYPKEKVCLKGNLLFVRENLSEDGMVLVREGPTALAYQGGMTNDFYMMGSNIFTCGWGFGRDELNRHGELTAYGSAMILFSGDERASLKALHDYQRALHKFEPARDAFVMSNT